MPRLNIISDKRKKCLRIYINETLHLYVKTDELVGVQSWYSQTTEAERNAGFFAIKYVIEYTTTKNIITTEYNKIEIWQEVLRLLDLHL